MRYSGTWLRPEDEAILEYLDEHGLAELDELAGSDTIEFSAPYIEQRCSQLAGRSGLVYFDRGRYGLTENGTAYLEGELDPSVLDSD